MLTSNTYIYMSVVIFALSAVDSFVCTSPFKVDKNLRSAFHIKKNEIETDIETRVAIR